MIDKNYDCQVSTVPLHLKFLFLRSRPGKVHAFARFALRYRARTRCERRFAIATRIRSRTDSWRPMERTRLNTNSQPRSPAPGASASMNQHIGASYTLSVLIVIGFALLMAKSDNTVPTRRDGAAKSNPRVKAREQTTEPVARVKVAPKPAQRQIEASIVMPASSPAPLTRPVSHIKPATAPKSRGEFTSVGPGESLAEVARRVYGSEAHVAKLWHANRDQLPDRSTPPRVGMTLRTP